MGVPFILGVLSSSVVSTTKGASLSVAVRLASSKNTHLVMVYPSAALTVADQPYPHQPQLAKYAEDHPAV